MLLKLFGMAAAHIADWFTDNSDSLGEYGERLTERKLRLVGMFGREGKILKNIYVPKDDGTTSEIDLIYITQKGIFVLESKNYSGVIYGSSEYQYWLQILPDGVSKRFYNPVRQNQTHVKWLKHALNRKIPMFSFIVFSERCELRKIEFDEKNVHVMKRDDLYAEVSRVWDKKPDVLSKKEIREIYNTLEPLTHPKKSVKRAHIEAIEQRKRNDGICPYCGTELVLRTAKKGRNAGSQFYGCSAFPKCRYTRDIE